MLDRVVHKKYRLTCFLTNYGPESPSIYESVVYCSHSRCSLTTRSSVYVTVGRLSVRLSVPSIDSSYSNSCRAPCKQEISIDGCRRHAAGAPALSGKRHADSRRMRIKLFDDVAQFTFNKVKLAHTRLPSVVFRS